jgi:hypothetical protein
LKTLLTPILLDYLIMEGYEYCLSKPANIDADRNSEYITLNPVKIEPFNNDFNDSGEPYLSIKNVFGIGDTLIMIEIDISDLRRYMGFFMERLTTSKPIFNLNIPEEC